MTFDVDLDDLATTLSDLAACQKALLQLAEDVRTEVAQVHTRWSGRAARAHAEVHATWAHGSADMVTALAALRTLGEVARSNYAAAVAANVAMWEQLA